MNRPSRMINLVCSILGLSILLACGGGSAPTPATPPTPTPPKVDATSLGYANPTSGTYRLVKNQVSSTPTHLVLDLLGPAGKVSGIGFHLTADAAKVSWVPVDAGDTEKVRSSIFNSTITKSLVQGDTLQAGIYQKGAAPAVSTLDTTVLASVALDLKSHVPVSGSATILLTSGKALILNEPANATATSPISITTGMLSAN